MVWNRDNNDARDIYNIFIKKSRGKKRRTLVNLGTNDILSGAEKTQGEREIEGQHMVRPM